MPDFTANNHGTVVMVIPHSKAAHDWVAENLQLESWQWFGPGFAVEPRYFDNLVDGIRNDGLEIEELQP